MTLDNTISTPLFQQLARNGQPHPLGRAAPPRRIDLRRHVCVHVHTSPLPFAPEFGPLFPLSYPLTENFSALGAKFSTFQPPIVENSAAHPDFFRENFGKTLAESRRLCYYKMHCYGE